ncbi:MAG TPA: SCO family protein [Clostridia bacterium]|nr:SCO family protein [Clostridia bacterium]
MLNRLSDPARARWRFLHLALCVFLVASLRPGLASDNHQILPAPGQHPLMHFPFTNELGQAVTLGQFRGKALAITFIFTRCSVPDYCPRLSKNFLEASQKLRAMPNAPTNWHFLSVTFDPQFDTPVVLKAYGQLYNYDSGYWNFLTGPTDKIAELARLSGMKLESTQGSINHNLRTLIIDPAGKLQTTFPIGGNLSEAIVTEILKAAAATNMIDALASANGRQ